MSEAQKAVVLNGGRELEVGLVAGAEEYLHELLGGAPVKSGWTTLRVVKNAAGRPFIAVIIGNKHVGFLSQAVTPDLLPALAACEEQGALAKAKGSVGVAPTNGGKAIVKVSLAEPDDLMRALRPAVPDVEAPAPEPALEVQAAPPPAPAPEPVPRPVAPWPPVPLQAEPAPTVAMTAMAPTTATAPLGPESPAATGAAEPTPADADGTTYSGQGALAGPYCPSCGFPYDPGAARCVCGYSFYHDTAKVVKDTIVSTSPMALPEGCVKCGEAVWGGRRLNKTLHYCTPWVWLTAIAWVLIAMILYMVLRKPLQISYSLCSNCSSKLNVKKWIAISVWVLFIVAVGAAIATGNLIPLAATPVLFLGALVASVIANPPLRVTGYDQGRFSVKGASPVFLSRLEEAQRP